ncbi:exodeoxyribonuclease VII large subunit [Sorangium sp. So ce362]|uniref:exodeoxyribonuclease VII large subunit n=1 Tax=Sorangium sp. So ce362 TaxID=3133303 RepID=UPI003F606B61
MSRRVTNDGTGTLQIHFAFDRRLVEVVKLLPARRWNPEQKTWWVPEAHVVAVVDRLHLEGFAFCEVTQRLYRERGGALALDEARVAPVHAAEPIRADAPRDRMAPRPSSTTPATPAASDFTVSQLNGTVRAALEAAFPASIWLVGEVCSYNRAAHKSTVGFELVERDAHGKTIAEIKATLFDRARSEIERRLAAAGNPFQIEDEIQIRVRGRVELYVPWGSYRFMVEDLDVGYTLGEAARRRDEIRRRLAEEGLLEQNRSLPFPTLPLRVGLVTSLGSDAYNDVLGTFKESGFAFRVVAHGVRVQGRQTEPSVLNALDYFRAHAAELDVLLICRGGGSRTDLAWFDSEPIARAVATFPLPVVVGIGHERDMSALDFVGWREKTPTAAAASLVKRVSDARDAVESSLLNILDQGRRALRSASSDLTRGAARVPRTASLLIARRAGQLQEAARQLRQGARRDLDAASHHVGEMASLLGPRSSRRLALESERVDSRGRRLRLLDPRRVVERGYAILRTEAGTVLTDAARAPRGTTLTAELKQGVLRLRSDGSEEK